MDYSPPPLGGYEKEKMEKHEVTDDDMLDFFIEFMNYEALGKIDNSHLALAD